MKKMSLLLGLISLIGCVSNQEEPPVKLKKTFLVNEVEFVKAVGNSTVEGSAFIKLEDGSLKGCSGFHVELLPASQYANERIYWNYKNNERGQILMSQKPPKFEPDVKEYHDYVIKTECDNNNTFEFSHVPAGDYYVIAFIIWGDKPDFHGGAVMQKLSVADSSTYNVKLEQ